MRFIVISLLCLVICVGGGVLANLAAAPSTESPALSYDEGYAVAQKENRPLIVMVGAKWCPHCPAAKTSIPELRKRGVVVYVDADRDKEVVERIGEKIKLPAVIVFDKEKDGKPCRKVLIGSERIAAWAVRPPRQDVRVNVTVR